MSSASTFESAVQRHRDGRLGEAERLYLQVVAEDPDHVNASYLLGVIAMQGERFDEAADRFLRASVLDARNPAFHANLGEAYRRLGRHSEALAALTRAMSLKQDFVEPIFNLGLLLQDHKELDGAIACFERAAELRPNVQQITDQFEAARKECAASGRENGRNRESASSSARLLVELAIGLAVRAQGDDAIGLCRRAIELEPRLVAAHVNLGILLTQKWQLDDAIASIRRALDIEPDQPGALSSLGNALMRLGRIDEGMATFRRALALNPKERDYHSNILFCMHFMPDHSAEGVLDEARDWDRRHAVPVATIAPHSNDRTPDRKLRIGYVSPDFRDHCQSFFTVPTFSHHDRQQFEIYCYANVLQPDGITDRIRSYADQWRDITAIDDETAAARIRDDRIDILVDLTMHMDRNRLLTFARKPAPVQVTWLAYPGTTGLSTMDYRVTDPYLDPPESDAAVYAERSLHLPDTFWCYDPLTTEPEVSPMPARVTGHVHFGCLNNFCKVNAGVIELWSRVLRAVDGCRLTLMAPVGEPREKTLQAFGKHGIDAGRIEFAPFRPRAEYLNLYQSFDVCLDTFPYNGHTTSLDAFWMGVPVVTLVGATVVGRAGLSQATNLGLTELIATTLDEYVEIAVGLCRDLDRLDGLRSGLRTRVQESPLMDAHRFTRNLEAAYRSVWRRWCDGDSNANQ
jgi:protein O-GlcNAc transferase